MRYDIDTPRTERYNRMSYFDLGRDFTAGRQRVPADSCAYCANLLGAMSSSASMDPRSQVRPPRQIAALSSSKNL